MLCRQQVKRLREDGDYWTIVRFLLPEHPRKFLLQFAIDRVNVTSVKIEYLVPYLIFQAIEQDNETGLDRLILPTIQVSWSSPERLPR